MTSKEMLIRSIQVSTMRNLLYANGSVVLAALASYMILQVEDAMFNLAVGALVMHIIGCGAIVLRYFKTKSALDKVDVMTLDEYSKMTKNNEVDHDHPDN